MIQLNRSLRVPKGYETNGANIPKAFWCIIPPFRPKYLPAVTVHDFLCDKEEYEKADRLFKRMLLESEDSIFTRAMVIAVKAYHMVKYKDKYSRFKNLK